MTDRTPAVRSCLQSNAEWRRQAANLRTHAARSGLPPNQRDCLLREAVAADRQADIWLAGAIEAD